MCGASTFALDWTAGGGTASRRLLRNISCNSSIANNAGGSSTGPGDDTAIENDCLPYHAAGCSDAWDTAVSCGEGLTGCSAATSASVQRFERTSFDSARPHLPCIQTPLAAAPMQLDSQQLLIGTAAGLYMLDLGTAQVQQVALASVPVAYVCCSSSGLVLAACPKPDDDACSSTHAALKEAAGLYCLNMGQQSSCHSGFAAGSDSGIAAIKLWDGGATCCAFAPEQSCNEDEHQAVPRIYVGTQPADLIYSDDLGSSFHSCSLSAAPAADSWYRRLPPYEPSVRAINFAGSSVAAAAAAAGDVQQPELLVAVEVGGVLASPQQAVGQDGSSDCSWTDCSQALCRDVHALQADPFNPKVLYAVAGSGQLPGGLYRCKGKGQKWKRLFGYRYSVGMAISAYQKGRMLLISADKPPATGCILFESVDGGRSWVNISDDVADAAAALTEHAPDVLDQAPLAMFVPGGLVLACSSGHVLHGTCKPLGGYSNWKVLATLPAAVSCMCSTDAAVAPVSVQRS